MVPEQRVWRRNAIGGLLEISRHAAVEITPLSEGQKTVHRLTRDRLREVVADGGHGISSGGAQ